MSLVKLLSTGIDLYKQFKDDDGLDRTTRRQVEEIRSHYKPKNGLFAMWRQTIQSKREINYLKTLSEHQKAVIEHGALLERAAHRYSNLPKRHFLVKIGKDHTVESTTPDVIEPKFSNKDAVIEKYVRERLEDPWYLPKYEIENQIKSRLPNEPKTTNSIPPVERTVSNSKTNSDPKKTKRKSLLDLGREAEKFIRNDKTSE